VSPEAWTAAVEEGRSTPAVAVLRELASEAAVLFSSDPSVTPT
jgi:hypothetical protein